MTTTALRREVESLLPADTSGVSFLDRLPLAERAVLAAGPSGFPPDRWTHAVSTPFSAAGLRIGPYEIVALLGAGAMGEVYRACDTKLNRRRRPEGAARACSPSILTARRGSRAKRRLLATLNHPNIGAIYGLEESNGAQALVVGAG